MNKMKSIITISLLPMLLMGCSNVSLSLEQRLHDAFLDVIEEDENDLRTLVSLTHEDSLVTWNQDNEKVLLFTLHRFPSSYIEGEVCVITWKESWLCSVKEYAKWYKDNKDNMKDENGVGKK